MPETSVEDLVRQEAGKAGIPPELALAVADQESGFNPTAKSKAGALGVMQLMPSTAQLYGIDPTNPLQNIQGGVKHLKSLMDQYQGDLPKVLAAYNSGRTDNLPAETQNYVPSVMGKLQKYAVGGPPPPTGAQGSWEPETTSQKAIRYGREMVSGLDPRTRQGRRNLAGGLGAAALTAVAPEATFLGMTARGVAPLVGAYLGGGTAEAGEQAISTLAGAPPPPTGRLQAIQEAGGQEMGYEALGKAAGAVVGWPLRKMLSSSVGRAASEKVGQTLESAHKAFDSVINRVDPAQAGRAVDAVAQGPARKSLGQIGQRVEEATQSGPALDWRPVKERVKELAAQLQPAPANEVALPVGAGSLAKMSPEQIQEMADAMTATIGKDHPLPAALQKIAEAPDEVSFADAHKYKRLLDETVNWESPAKRQVSQITKATRQTIRDTMAVHEPYNQATEAYRTTLALFEKGTVKQLHRAATENPESIASLVKRNQPTKLAMLKEVLTTHAEQGGGQAAGQNAWNGVRSVWTHKNLIAPGIEKFDQNLAKVDPQFLSTMYGDQEGKTVLGNLQKISGAYQAALQKETALGKVGKNATPLEFASAAGHLLTGPLSPWAWRHAAQTFSKGASSADLLQWAAYSNTRTNLLVHALQNPALGVVGADIIRHSQKQEVGTPPPAIGGSNAELGAPPAP